MWLLHEGIISFCSVIYKLTVLIFNLRWNRSTIKIWTLKSSVLLQSAHISLRLLKNGRQSQVQLSSILNRKETESLQLRNWHRYIHPSFWSHPSFWRSLIFLLDLLNFNKYFVQEMNLGPTAHSLLKDWIRSSDGKLSFLGYTKFLHGVTIRGNTRHR